MKNQLFDRPTLLVWDKEGQPPQGDWFIIFWRCFYEGDGLNGISLPKLVEEQAENLRSRYLEWIYKLGETRIKGKRVIDNLELRPGFSYWWMTLLAEKDDTKSPRIYDAVRLLALEELIIKLQPLKIILAGSNKTVAKIIGFCCRKTGIDFEWNQSQKPDKQISPILYLYDSLPYPIKAVSLLMRYIWKKWSITKNLKDVDNLITPEITFVDYLIHLNISTFETGRFASNFWTNLLEIFNQDQIRVNWLHLFVQHDLVRTPKHAMDLIAQFNQSGDGLESHALLDCELNLSSALATLSDYLKISWLSWRLDKIGHYFSPADSNLDFWPLFKQDWFDSMQGPTAMWNCLVLNLIEKKLKHIPHQKLGVYLQENQGWEMAFIYAWRSAGHGRLIGVPHSTIRYWDLRYFSDPRNYIHVRRNGLPLPDHVALNGPMAMNAYRKGKYSIDQLVEVEALRYLYLKNKGGTRTKSENSSSSLIVLVCGDYLPVVSRQMMLWLVSAANEMPTNTRYLLRPHPSCAILARDYPSLKMQLTSAPLSELLTECDVAFTSNITSAAVDAYCAGVQVVQVLDGNAFNMSPLRGLKGVKYVTNPSELAEAFLDIQKSNNVIVEPYFYLDYELPRWRKLLGLIDNEEEKAIEN